MLVLLVVLAVPALLAGLIAPHDPVAGDLGQRLKPPAWGEGGSWNYVLGTDKQGRDILSRLIFGARISLGISLSAVLIAGSVGTCLGLLGGYLGGYVDHVVLYLIDSFLTLPLILVTFQRGSDESITAALALVFLAPVVLAFAVSAKYLRWHA